MSLADKLRAHGFELRNFGNGNQKVRCPKCSHQRKNANDPCCSVTIGDDGAVWKCHHCQWSGGERDGDDAPRGEVVKFRGPPPAFPFIGSLTDEMEKYLATRGLTRPTLDVAGIGAAAYFIPAKKAQVPCIAFPYRKPGGEIINIKFRTRDKEFAKVKGGAKILFGWDRCDLGETQLVICEGEIDALSITQCGISNGVSVPDGAQDRKWDYLDDEVLKFQRIVIATDADKPGQELASELARRFGYERSWLVTWPQDCKDANDVLVKLGEDALREVIANAAPYPIAGLHTFDEYREDILRLYRGGERRGVTTGWRSLDQHMTIRTGELSVVTGIPGSGKSEFIDALTVNLSIANGWTFAVCSFENPPDEHFAKYAEKFTGMPFHDGPTPRMSEQDAMNILDVIKQKFFLIRTDDNAPTVDYILERARAATIRHGIRGLVIDPYNEIEHQRPHGMTETEYVSDMLNKIKRFARNHDIHVWFVAHPAKPMRKQDGTLPEPSLYDISGSANWANKADLGIVVVRDYTEGSRKVTVHIKKVRFKAVGRQGSVDLIYDRVTGRYEEDRPPYPSRSYEPN